MEDDERKKNEESVGVEAKSKSNNTVGYGGSGGGIGNGMGYWEFTKPFIEGGSARLLANFLGALLRVRASGSYTKFQMPKGCITKTLSCAALYGSYENIRRAAIFANDKRPLSWFQEVNCGLIAGAIGACVFVPTVKVEGVPHLATVSRAADYVKHKNAYHLISHILATQGILGLWKTDSRVLGAMTVYMTGMITLYNKSFDYFKNFQFSNDFTAHMGATAFSGLITPILAYPFIVASLYRCLLMEKNIGNTNTLVLAMKLIRLRGLSSFCSHLPIFVRHHGADVMGFLLSLYFVQHLKILRDL